MNSHCSICDVEDKCAYPYKPCDCCNYRKFKPKANHEPDTTASLNTETKKHSATRPQLRLVTR